MVWAAKGVKGVLTNGGARDTDEQLYQKAMPTWHRWVVQPMYQGRVVFGEPGSTVEIGGAAVKPGDLIAADGDGAIVVPQDVIADVLHYAKQESENDRYVAGCSSRCSALSRTSRPSRCFPTCPIIPTRKSARTS